jgi:uncharacterized membrane protein YtjA (UPF0391 family)
MFLSMAITFFIMSIVAGVLGFGVLDGDAAWIGKAAFFIFLVAFGLSFLMTGHPPHHGNT